MSVERLCHIHHPNGGLSKYSDDQNTRFDVWAIPEGSSKHQFTVIVPVCDKRRWYL
jgi:hypothetical protein